MPHARKSVRQPKSVALAPSPAEAGAARAYPPLAQITPAPGKSYARSMGSKVPVGRSNANAEAPPLIVHDHAVLVLTARSRPARASPRLATVLPAACAASLASPRPSRMPSGPPLPSLTLKPNVAILGHRSATRPSNRLPARSTRTRRVVEQECEGCASTLALGVSCAPSINAAGLRTAARDVRARQGMGKGARGACQGLWKTTHRKAGARFGPLALGP